MPNAILDSAHMYLDKVVKAPYIYSKFAILHDPEKFEYSIYGESTRVREVTGGTAADYDPAQGFQSSEGQGSVVWSEFKAPFDRDITVPVDAVSEMNSITQGMQPSGPQVIERSWANFGGEIDATTCANIFSKVPQENKLTDTDYPLDRENAYSTLVKIENLLFNQGVDDVPAIVFTKSTVYAELQTAIVDKFGLANESVLKVNPSLDDKLEVSLSVIKFNNLYIVRVPDQRMISHVTLLDGKSAGQETGGWLADDDNPDFTEVELLVVPFDSAALSIRHLVTNFTVPARFMNLSTASIDTQLKHMNEYYQGSAVLRNIGIDQTGDMFRYMNRILYGSVVYETWKKTLFAVTRETGTEGA